MKIAGGPPSESYRLCVIASALLLAGPVWHYLYVNHYPPRTEMLLLVGGAALLGALAGALGHRIGGMLEGVGFGLLLYLFVDLQFDLDTHLRAPVLLAIAVGLSLLLQRRRALITCVTLGSFYVAALPRAGVARAEPAKATSHRDSRNHLPMLVHIVLDEHWGIGGLRYEGDTTTSAFLSDFYLRRGFEVYPSAYSRYHRTEESLPELVSLGRVPLLEVSHDPQSETRRLRSIPYFDSLAARGYEIRVIQSSYVDYCDATSTPVASCETESGNSVSNIGYLDGSAAARAMVAGRFFLNATSHVYTQLHPDFRDFHRSGVGGGLLALHHLGSAIATGPREGVAWFVHALTPHRPLEVTSDCGAVYEAERRVGHNQPTFLSDSEWTAALSAIDAQIRCTHHALGAVLDVIDSAIGRDQAIVLVHGDHGARIFQHAPRTGLAALDDRQLNGRFSTLLAVRRPGVSAGVHAEPVPVQDFVWRIARQGFRGPVSTDFLHFVHASHVEPAGADSIRMLAADHMPWSASFAVTPLTVQAGDRRGKAGKGNNGKEPP